MRQRQGVRVVHLTTVHHALDPRIVHKQLKTLRDAGYDAHLMAPRVQSGIVHGIPITALPEVEGRYQRLRHQRKIFRAAKALDADCYHFHDPELVPVAYALKQTTSACIIYDMHEDYHWHGPIEGRLIRALERWCFRWVDHVVLAELSYRTIVSGTGVDSTFIGNYMRPYDDKPPPRRIAMAFPIRLLYSGVTAQSRGLFHMIDLVECATATDEAAILSIVGVCNLPGQRRRAERMIQQRSLGAHIHRVGWDTYVPASTMPPYYRDADVGLALFEPDPNYVRSMPTKFYEYLHYGLPILCSDFPRWRQFIEQHNCGAAVSPGDTQMAHAVLRRWRKDPARYRTLSTAARAAASKYQWSIMGKRLVRLYDELLGIDAATE